jgi:hypothetical protein
MLLQCARHDQIPTSRRLRYDVDRQVFLEVLGNVVEKYNWLCHAFCLLDNHYHILVGVIWGVIWGRATLTMQYSEHES